jgi:hypothetical protein
VCANQTPTFFVAFLQTKVPQNATYFFPKTQQLHSYSFHTQNPSKKTLQTSFSSNTKIAFSHKTQQKRCKQGTKNVIN